MGDPEPFLEHAVLGVEPGPPLGVEHAGDDVHDPARVEHVHRLARVLGSDPHRGVLAGGGRAADQQRQLDPAALHLLRDVDHLVEGRCDQTRQPDHVGALGDRGVEDPLGGDHHAEVDHLVVVAAEDDPDDVLADVVHVALHGREHDRPLGAATLLLLLHVGLEIGDCALHRACRLDDLRQEHAARAEEVADDPHAVHQRPFDHVERTRQRSAGLLRVDLDEIDDPVHERVRQALLDRRLAPREVALACRHLALGAFGDLDQALGRIGPAREDHVLDALEQLLVDVFVDRELARVHDPHVEPGADRVVEERGVHRLADDVVAAEREAQVRDAAAAARARAALLDRGKRLQEPLGVVDRAPPCRSPRPGCSDRRSGPRAGSRRPR